MADPTNDPKPEDPEQPKDPKPEGGGSGPDWQRAAEDYKAQRDAAREQVGALNKSMEGRWITSQNDTAPKRAWSVP